ncbi:hypothetical protein ACFX2I_033562 [Malus domestica]
MSYTSLSWAMSWVSTASRSMSQMMHVVSMEEVPMRLGSASLQSKKVMGPQNSEFLLPLRRDLSPQTTRSPSRPHPPRCVTPGGNRWRWPAGLASGTPCPG